MIRARVERLARRLPVARDVMEARDLRRVRRTTGFRLSHPLGHYSSPIPALDEVRAREDAIFGCPESLPAIDVRADAQLALVEELGALPPAPPFPRAATPGHRYHYENPWFPIADAVILSGLLRHVRPRRLVEVGSGFSSAVILDTNDRLLHHELSCTFVEPHPERLHGLLRADDARNHRVLEQPVQDVPFEVFTQLEAGDILFVDSSHVGKVGSDVNWLLFEVLPRLPVGVYVHFHDITWPFEYPRRWIYEGRAWNEAYLLHALLLFSDDFEITLFNHYLAAFHRDEVSRHLPQWGIEGGGSLWLRRAHD